MKCNEVEWWKKAFLWVAQAALLVSNSPSPSLFYFLVVIVYLLAHQGRVKVRHCHQPQRPERYGRIHEKIQ